MTKNTQKGILLDVDYFLNEQNEAIIRLYLKTEKGISVFEDKKYRPYFYVLVDDAKKRIDEIKKLEFGQEKAKAKDVVIQKKENANEVLKVFFKNTQDLKIARDEIVKNSFVLDKREYDILFAKRYLIDNDIQPMNGLQIEFENKNEIVSLKVFDVDKKDLEEIKSIAFDLETYSPGRFSDSSKDPIISIGLSQKNSDKFFAWSKAKKQNDMLENETKVIESFFSEVEKISPQIIVTYNGDNFDFPYIKERARKNKVEYKKAFGSEIKIKKMGLEMGAVLSGLQHVDAYKLIRLLNRFGVTSLIKFDLESVHEALYGKPKEKVTNIDINIAFETGEGMQRMLNYNLEDSNTTLRIANDYLPLYVEISKLVRQTLFDSTRSGASSLVEDLLLQKAFELNFLAPNRPNEGEVKNRNLQSFKGGYVKEPVAGLHENIAVLDFRSLHPSIMVAHNVSPETLKCSHSECVTGKNLSPDKDWFCEKQKGFIPMVVEEILKERIKAKKQMQQTNKENPEYAFLKAKQQALKILLNSHYGYLGYPRARWYSRECAKAITAWSRHYVQNINDKAESNGYTPIYSDTDSNFLLVPKGKTKEDVSEFVKKINTELPETMELEFENYYKRGIFVTKREGGAAKKKYALIDFNNKLKIVGFEYVRRDWAKIAKDTQREVLEAVLMEGKPERAIEIVRQKIKLLREGKIPKKDLIIMTQLKKPIKKYDSIGPHVAAAMKAVQRGKEIGVGSTLDFIITKNGKSISEKSELAEYVKEGNYDADYYIEHQLVPAVSRIIEELGVKKDDLIHGGTQRSLGSFM